MKNKKVIITTSVLLVLIIAVILSVLVNSNKTPKNHVITFNSNGGTFVNSQIVLTGSKVIQPTEPQKEGYAFISWELNNKTYDFSEKVKKDIVLDATWEEKNENQVVVKFNSSGGTTIPSQVVEKGENVEKPKPPTQEGYIFTGWESNNKEYDFDNPPTEDTEIIAKWEKDPEYKPEEQEKTKEEPKPQPEQKPDTNQPTKITNPNRNRNTIHFISTCSSDAILIESNGVFGLIDSSNPYNDGTQQQISNKQCTVQNVIEYMDSIGVKYLDFVLATHAHSDHIGGMVAIANKYITDKTTYYYRVFTYGTDNQPSWDNYGYYARSMNAVTAKGANLVEITNQTPTYTYGNFKLTFLNTDPDKSVPENHNAIGTLVQLGNKKIFLSADIEAIDANKVAPVVGKVDVMKLNHHGYSGTTYEYLTTLKPQHIVITNSSVTPAATAPIAYAKENYQTVTYITGNVKDAIRLNVTTDSYSFENTGKEVIPDATNWVNWEGKYVYLENGKLKKSWLKWNTNWYYLNTEGLMVKGWNELNWSGGKNWFYFGTDGIMKTGWQKLDWAGGNHWFYFDKTDGYMVTGWQQLSWSGGKSWFYFQPTHGYLIQNQCMTIDNKNYCFNNDGVCTTGC